MTATISTSSVDTSTCLSDLTDVELDERIRAIEAERRRLDAELASAIAEGEARQLNAVDAHRSMRGYCRATANWSGPETTSWIRASRVVRTHPAIGEAWAAGRIGLAQVKLFGRCHVNPRVTDRLGEFVEILLEHAEQLTYPDFSAVVERFEMLADVDGTHRPELDEPGAARTAVVATIDGSIELRMSGGDGLTTAEYLAILERYVDAEWKKDQESGTMRSAGQRRFDALVAMARSAAANDGFVSTPSEPLVSIVIDERTWSDSLAHSGLGAATSLDGEAIDPFTGLPRPADLLDDLLGSPETLLSRRCETTNGVQLRPIEVLQAALSGHVRRVVLGAKSVPIDLGRSSRLFTGKAREAAMLLMRRCDHPGCDLPAEWCQVDHSTGWLDHGRTDQDNAGVECGFHNRAKHRKRFRTRRALNGRVHTSRPDGTIMLPVGCREPRFDEPADDDDLDDRPDSALDETYLRVLAESARNRLTVFSEPSARRPAVHRSRTVGSRWGPRSGRSPATTFKTRRHGDRNRLAGHWVSSCASARSTRRARSRSISRSAILGGSLSESDARGSSTGATCSSSRSSTGRPSSGSWRSA
ncbi:MAG: DUF222 domain-containing protein [Actinomycetota bacterium]